MRIIFFILTILIFFSCESKKSYNKMIVDHDSSYWDFYDHNRKNIIGSYLFKANGECFKYFYTKQDSFFRYNDEDVLVPNTWEIVGDSVLKIRAITSRILYISSDSMILIKKNLADTLFLRKNSNK